VLTIVFFITSTQLGLAASSGGSSSGGSSSGGSSYSGDESSNSMDAPNVFDKAYQLIDDKKYAEAYKELKSLGSPRPRDDFNNLLGFTARKSGNLDKAADYYALALEINPKHVGALQYQGELFITLGQIEKAKQNLKQIGKICWLFPCAEEQLLEVAISEASDD
jgi:tetratricopeptide (TPR) repeat protein